MRTSNRARIASALLALIAASCQPEASLSSSDPSSEHTEPPVEEFDSGVAVSSNALITGNLTPAPIADTVLRSGVPFGNDGLGQVLGVTSASVADVKRSIVRFNEAQMKAAFPVNRVLQSARLDIVVTGISAGWLGGAIDLHAMNREWVEGTGLLGNGASWVCANDTNTTLLGNLVNNCTTANNWSMTTPAPYPRPFNTTATDRVPVFTGGLTTISFDVTEDVRAVRAGGKHYGWMLAGAPNLLGGLWVNFGSRETLTAKPKLTIFYGTDECPSDPNKGLPGACGCGNPDFDTNLDDVADCFDAAIPATGDTAIRLAVPFGNDGTGIFLPTTAASIVDIERTLVKVDNATINAARHGAPVTKAYLEFTVAGIAIGWAGGQLALHRMNATPAWVEGTGLDGHGASWSCADDFNTTLLGNVFNDCVPADNWYMSPFQWTLFPKPYVDPPTGIIGVTWPGMNSVRFDVTADVQAFLANPASNNGWILQGHASNFASGNWVNFSSRETAAPPRLLLEFPTECPTTGKLSPGACGCSIPETDTDGDGTPDCVDECPNNNPRIVKGVCGCGAVVHSDSDGIPDCIDPCPNDGDPSLGGTCGCPSDPAPPGTLCEGPCGGSGDPGGLDVCDGAGHCGAVPGSASCPSPDPSCPGCRALVVQGLSNSTPFSVYWHCPCTRGGTFAEGACDDVPGHHLAQVSSVEQNAFIRSLIDSDTWIGANDRSIDGDWRWEWSEGPDGSRFWSGGASGTARGYENWQSGEPGGGDSEDCGAMLFTGTSGQWQDRSCGQSLDFICERSIEITDDDDGDHLDETERTCTYLGNRCPPFGGTCVDQDTLPELADPEALELALKACDDCTKMCTRSDPPTQAQQDACRIQCTQQPMDPPDSKPCRGDAAPPDPATSVPCENLNDYELDPTTLFEPPPEKHCAIKVPAPAEPLEGLVACVNHQECVAKGMPAGFQHCGEVFHCRDCDPTSEECDQCVGEVDLTQIDPPPASVVGVCPSRMVGGFEQNVCVAQKYCGEPVEECHLDDDLDVFCAEYNLCVDPENVHALPGPPNAEDLKIAEIFDPNAPGAFNVPPIAPPDPYFPEDKACPTDDCVAPNNPLHPWCHYDVTEGLVPQSPDTLQKPVETGSNTILSFDVSPTLNLIYETELGPLGMPLPLLAAEAAFVADAEINIFGMSKPLPLIDIAAGARGGIHKDADPDRQVCGFKAYARAELLGIDVLPEDVNFAVPGMNGDEDIQEQCLEAVDEFRTVVDSARKAFADARELVRQYKALKEDQLYFPDGSDENVPSFCEQIAKSPPRGFPIWGDCETEKPVDTINRFIAFYNQVAIQNVRDAAARLGTELDALIAAQGVNQKFPILTPVQGDEQITIFNTTFMVGPVPCNLEVLLTMQYGVGADLMAEFRIGQLISDIVGSHELTQTPVLKAGLGGGPSAGIGLSLFAGVGFDIGFAAAKIGIDGAIDLGHASVDATAWAGLGVIAKPDDREPPLSWAEDVDAESGHLIPTKRLAFDLMWGYRSDLHLKHVLSGSLGVRLKLKFFFFSRNYRKAIITFDGLCPPEDPGRDDWCDIPLFRSGSQTDLDWGEIELPMPFFPIKFLDTWPVDPTGTEELDTSKVGEVFYDSQCQCVPMWSDFSPPKQDCYRPEDCCSQESYPGVLICFTNPEPVDGEIRSQCTTCRAPEATCTKDSECCNAETHSCYKEAGPDAPVGVCRPKGVSCWDCTRDEDCSDAAVERECGPRNFCISGPDSCTVD